MYKGAGFAPGHISGLFGVYADHPHGSMVGSRGGGLCIEKGAWSLVELRDGDGRITVNLNDVESSAPVTRLALSMMLKSRGLDANVDIRLDLPIGQGFGMSSAGTLASAFAVKAALPEIDVDPLMCTHLAEVSVKTGMGDAVAQSMGGMVVRERQGLPPAGLAKSFKGCGVVVGMVGEPISTSEMLSNPEILERTRSLTYGLLPILSRRPDMETFMNISRRFSEEAGLITPSVREALDAVGRIPCSMIMLGNAVFCMGDEGVVDKLSGLGDVFMVDVAREGAGIVEVSEFEAGKRMRDFEKENDEQ